MKKKNSVYITGKIVNYDKLEKKEFSNGNEGIVGRLTLQVNEEGSTLDVKCFASPKYSNGKKNYTYDFLEGIIDGSTKAICDVGVEEADFISISGRFSTDYFPGRDGCTDPDDLTESFYITASFIQAPKKPEYSVRWTMDMLITSIREKEENPENGDPRSVIVRGYYIDDYNKRLLGCHFEAFKEAAVNYYIGISEMATEQTPYFAEVWGGVIQFVSKSVLKNNFGDDEVREYKRTKLAIEGMADQMMFETDAVSLSEETYNLFKEGLDSYKEQVFKEHIEENDAGADDLSF